MLLRLCCRLRAMTSTACSTGYLHCVETWMQLSRGTRRGQPSIRVDTDHLPPPLEHVARRHPELDRSGIQVVGDVGRPKSK